MDFLDFKKKSVLEHINEFLYNDVPFGTEKYEFESTYTTYTIGDYKASVRNGIEIEVDIRHNPTYTNALSYAYVPNDSFETLSTPSMSYYKSKGCMWYKLFRINGVTYLVRTSQGVGKTVECEDDFGKFKISPSENGKCTSFETRFTESQDTNITIQERLEYGEINRSVIFFRDKDLLDSTRRVMYDVDISKFENYVRVIITIGYRNEITFDIMADDASVLNLFDSTATFQSELTFDESEYKVFQHIKDTIKSKLHRYHELGGHMSVVNTMLENINSMQ